MGTVRHVQPFKHFTRLWVDTAQVAFVAFPRAMPQLAIDSGHARNEPVAFDRAQHLTGLGIDLMDPAAAVLTNPERSFGPGQS